MLFQAETSRGVERRTKGLSEWADVISCDSGECDSGNLLHIWLRDALYFIYASAMLQLCFFKFIYCRNLTFLPGPEVFLYKIQIHEVMSGHLRSCQVMSGCVLLDVRALPSGDGFASGFRVSSEESAGDDRWVFGWEQYQGQRSGEETAEADLRRIDPAEVSWMVRDVFSPCVKAKYTHRANVPYSDSYVLFCHSPVYKLYIFEIYLKAIWVR